MGTPLGPVRQSVGVTNRWRDQLSRLTAVSHLEVDGIARAQGLLKKKAPLFSRVAELGAIVSRC